MVCPFEVTKLKNLSKEEIEKYNLSFENCNMLQFVFVGDPTQTKYIAYLKKPDYRFSYRRGVIHIVRDNPFQLCYFIPPYSVEKFLGEKTWGIVGFAGEDIRARMLDFLESKRIYTNYLAAVDISVKKYYISLTLNEIEDLLLFYPVATNPRLYEKFYRKYRSILGKKNED